MEQAKQASLSGDGTTMLRWRIKSTKGTEHFTWAPTAEAAKAKVRRRGISPKTCKPAASAYDELPAGRKLFGE